MRSLTAKILVCQSGYSLNGVKRFLVESGRPGWFEVISAWSRTPVFKGMLRPAGEAWGRTYLMGDFTGLARPGWYRVRVSETESPPFKLCRTPFTNTLELAAKFFYYQRCGCEVPGLHGPCHLDDAYTPEGDHIDLRGGWHEAGDYNKHLGYQPHAVYALAYAFEKLTCSELREGTPLSRIPYGWILDEALWGARFLLKMQVRDGRFRMMVISGVGYWGPPEKEENPRILVSHDAWPVSAGYCIAAFAKLSKILERNRKDVSELLKSRAVKAWRHYSRLIENIMGRSGFNLFDCYNLATFILAGLELERLGVKTRNMVDAIVSRICDAMEPYLENGWFNNDLQPPPFHIVEMGVIPAALVAYCLAGGRLKEMVERAVKSYMYSYLLPLTDNVFNIPKFYISYKDKNMTVWFLPGDYFGDWHVGPNSYYLSTAWALLLASKLFRDGWLRLTAQRILEWILGVNPYGICMVEGAGSRHLPEYHHRYGSIPGWERGAVPGAIPNGICRRPLKVLGKRVEGVDEPFIDMDFRGGGRAFYVTNEPWLPHNAYYLLATSLLSI